MTIDSYALVEHYQALLMHIEKQSKRDLSAKEVIGSLQLHLWGLRFNKEMVEGPNALVAKIASYLASFKVVLDQEKKDSLERQLKKSQESLYFLKDLEYRSKTDQNTIAMLLFSGLLSSRTKPFKDRELEQLVESYTMLAGMTVSKLGLSAQDSEYSSVNQGFILDPSKDNNLIAFFIKEQAVRGNKFFFASSLTDSSYSLGRKIPGLLCLSFLNNKLERFPTENSQQPLASIAFPDDFHEAFFGLSLVEGYEDKLTNVRKDYCEWRYILHLLQEHSFVATWVPNGPLFRGMADGEAGLRRRLLADNLIECVVQFSQKQMPGSKFGQCLLILNKYKQSNSIEFIDAREHLKPRKTLQSTDEIFQHSKYNLLPGRIIKLLDASSQEKSQEAIHAHRHHGMDNSMIDSHPKRDENFDLRALLNKNAKLSGEIADILDRLEID